MRFRIGLEILQSQLCEWSSLIGANIQFDIGCAYLQSPSSNVRGS